MTNIADEIRQYIIDEFLPGESPENLADDAQLRTSGILDSMSTLKLVAHVERTYGITIEANEASSSFDTIRDIDALVQRKQA
jgi:acyl carrier protein